MSDLKVRAIDFQFDNDIPFYWNRGNSGWGNFVNLVTIIAPAFERYFIKAIRQALPLIKDPVLQKNADLFCQQEAQHSRQHLAHMRVLTNHYPGLEETRKEVLDSYETLFASRTMEFHLSYAASVEQMFGPIARFVIENREALFKDCDNRIAAFMLWHLIEEFEHRHAAIDVYKHIVGSYGYRIRSSIDVWKHLMEVELIARKGFIKHVPVMPGELAAHDLTSAFKGVPVSRQLGLAYDLFCTLLPLHNPDSIKQPDWATQWFADEAAGKDMRLYVP